MMATEEGDWAGGASDGDGTMAGTVAGTVDAEWLVPRARRGRGQGLGQTIKLEQVGFGELMEGDVDVEDHVESCEVCEAAVSGGIPLLGRLDKRERRACKYMRTWAAWRATSLAKQHGLSLE